MTNSPEGLTFIDYSWVATLDGYSYTSHTNPNEVRRTCRDGYYINKGEVVTEVRSPRFVPNGSWLTEKPFGCNWLVGVERDELEMLEYHDKDGIYHQLFICDKPFGFIMMDSEDVIVYPDMVKSYGRKTLVYARQIHKGELGRGVPTPTLDYIRQPLASHRGLGMKARERRRGQNGWVEMRDLGMAAAMPFRRLDWIELVMAYWQFSGHLAWENGQRVGIFIDTMRGSSSEIEHGNTKVVSMTPAQFRAEAEEDSDELWIRRGFAYTILRLLALGVKPGVTQPI